MNQVVLDLDLDFVMGEQCHTALALARRELDQNVSVSILEFERFLDKLGLEYKSDGLGFETHTITAKIWEHLILQGILKPPFTVIHVDAHHDIYTQPRTIKRPLLNCGNYLVPFLENGLIDKLVWIAPRACASWCDRGWYAPEKLKLISYERKDFQRELNNALNKRPYTFITVAFSPNYCGTKADALIPILMSRLAPRVNTIKIMRDLSQTYIHEFTRARFYLEESPYFETNDDGTCARVDIFKLVSRINQ